MIKGVFHQIIKTRLHEKVCCKCDIQPTYSKKPEASQRKNSQKKKIFFSYLNTSFVGVLTIYCACMCMHAKSLSRVQLCMTLWTVACQALLSMEFSR